MKPVVHVNRLRPLLFGGSILMALTATADAGAAGVRNQPASPATVQVQSATLSRLHTLATATDGVYAGPMSAGADGNFYGTTRAGGVNGFGTLYRLTPDGNFSILHDFTVDEGGSDDIALVQGPDGSLYGSTFEFYSNGVILTNGTVIFRISPEGDYSVVYTFPNDGSEGSGIASLAIGSDGTIYGTKATGGTDNDGVVFKIDSEGQFTLLHSFSATDGNRLNSDGAQPRYPSLAGDGTLWGVTNIGGANGVGTVFKVASDGTFTATSSLSGVQPGNVQLLSGHDGRIYGSARYTNGVNKTNGGYVFTLTTDGQVQPLYNAALGFGQTYVNDLLAGNDGNLYAVIYDVYEEIVRITADGKHSIVHTFDKMPNEFICGIGCEFVTTGVNQDGNFSLLSQDSTGNLYGVATAGGVDQEGTLYRIAPDGTFTLLYSFDNSLGRPSGTLAAGGDGNLYGVIYPDSHGQSDLFRLSPEGSINVTASFSQATAKVGDDVTLTWNSTGATSCSLTSDIANAQGVLAASGSMNVVPSSNFVFLPLTIWLSNDWVALVQCTAADGSQAGVALRLPKY